MKCKITNIEVMAIAEGYGWSFASIDKITGMISFIKLYNGTKARINVYRTTMTVTTQLAHPKAGKNQLHRRNVSRELLAKIFKNPRIHTKKGYRRKK